MITTPAAAAAEIQRLDLPPILSAIVTGALPSDCAAADYIRAEFRPPEEYFRLAADLTQRTPNLNGLCPLWEQNGEAVIGRLPDGSYVRCHYEDGACEVLGRNYSQFVTSLLLELSDAGMWTQYGDALAEEFEYQHIDQLHKILDTWASDEDEARLEEFRTSLAD